MLTALLTAVLLTGAGPAAAAPSAMPGHGSPADTARLRASIMRLVDAHQGTVGVSVRNLATGESLSIRGDETFPTQSTIKVSLLVALLDEVQKGRVRLDERTGLIDRDKVQIGQAWAIMLSASSLAAGWFNDLRFIN